MGNILAFNVGNTLLLKITLCGPNELACTTNLSQGGQSAISDTQLDQPRVLVIACHEADVIDGAIMCLVSSVFAESLRVCKSSLFARVGLAVSFTLFTDFANLPCFVLNGQS